MKKILKRLFQVASPKNRSPIIRSSLEERTHISREYYQSLHDDGPAYQANNWLVGREDLMKAIVNAHVLEIGTGNGRFLSEAQAVACKVTGVDWARSPLINNEAFSNVEFVQADIREFDIPNVDVLCSGDVLEHFSEEDLSTLLPKLVLASKINFHVIACYDDGHSHLTVKPPEWWEEQFRNICPDTVFSTEKRGEKLVCVLVARRGE